MNTCKTCKWWGKAWHDERTQEDDAYKGCGAVVNGNDDDSPRPLPIDGIVAYASYGEDGIVETGADFGCIKWEAEQPPVGTYAEAQGE